MNETTLQILFAVVVGGLIGVEQEFRTGILALLVKEDVQEFRVIGDFEIGSAAVDANLKSRGKSQ